MKILLDPQIFIQQKYGGISRYYTEIFSVLSRKKDVEVILPVYNSDNAYLKNTDLPTVDKNFKRLINILSFFKISTRTLRKKKSDKLLNKIFQENSYDVFVPTYYNPYFLDQIQGKPFVLTIYDMIHELMPQFFVEDPFNVTENKSKLVEKATRIIAVSHNTKKDILKFFPNISPEKISVIYHGNSIKIDDSVHVDLPKNYILYVGARASYKNFRFLVKAAAPLLKKDSGLILLAAGGGEFDEEENEFINQLGLKDQIIQRNFGEKELGHFYKNAKCFVLPSLYEGFGIPVLESMACSCPIILSKHSSLPEVAGEAGFYYDSNSEEDLRKKIETLLTNEVVRKQCIDKGLEQVKKFSWNDAAEQCLQVYREASEDYKKTMKQ